jgi:glycosyltransferase involved in cell wall biosynthesis
VTDRPLHIGIDGRELLDKPTGVGRYLAALLEEWTRPDAPPHRYTVFVPQAAPPLAARSDRLAWDVDADATSAGTWWEQMRLPARVARARPDVFFAAGYTAPLRLRCPFVVAVYDVSYFAHPEWFPPREGLRRRWLTKAAARRARSVVTISEFSAREIERFLGVPRARLRLAPPGPPPVRTTAAVGRDPLVLYVGSLLNRRHIDAVITGFAQAAPRVAGARLVLVGDNRTSPRLDPRAIAARLGVADRVEWREYVSDSELTDLYARARVFVFLSEYEGFGMTPLEALAHDVPAILLDTPVAREVVGDAARLIAAPGDLPHALTTLLEDDQMHAALVAAGRTRLGRFSWARSATVVRHALEEAARS